MEMGMFHCHVSPEKRPSYFPLYWLVNWLIGQFSRPAGLRQPVFTGKKTKMTRSNVLCEDDEAIGDIGNHLPTVTIRHCVVFFTLVREILGGGLLNSRNVSS